MGLTQVLIQNRSAIVQKWFDLVVDTYPSQTAQFIKSRKNPFANPVGNTTWTSLETLFNQLVGEMDTEGLDKALDQIVRIRAIQAFSPSQALSFIPALKSIIVDYQDMGPGKDSMAHADEKSNIASNLDNMLLRAFDIYMECKETLYQLRARDDKHRAYKAFERAGLLKQTPDR